MNLHLMQKTMAEKAKVQSSRGQNGDIQEISKDEWRSETEILTTKKQETDTMAILSNALELVERVEKESQMTKSIATNSEDSLNDLLEC